MHIFLPYVLIQAPQQGITSLDIIDTAVKIGLGALISGIATLLTIRLQQNGILDQERRNRKAKIIEDVTEKIENTNKAFLEYAKMEINRIGMKKNGVEIKKGTRIVILKAKEFFFHSVSELQTSEALLVLINDKQTAKLVNEYYNKIVHIDFFLNLGAEVSFDEKIQKIQELINETILIRGKIFASLSSSFRNV